MSSEFDPYRIWLGIPVNEQPANLYRLLGLALFESDDDVISNAADRQMAHVRTFQTGKYSEQSQKLLNELSAARVTLLDKKKKADYDARLKSELDSVGGSSMINLGNGSTPLQGSFIGGQSSVNLSPPPINGTEGSLLGVDLGLSSASKKKSGSSDKNVRDKSGKEKGGKGSPIASSSGSKRTPSKKNNNVGVIAGIIVGAVALIVCLFFIIMPPKTDTEEEYDPNDYSQSEFFQQRARMSQVPQQPEPEPAKPEPPEPPKPPKPPKKEQKPQKSDARNEEDPNIYALQPMTDDDSSDSQAQPSDSSNPDSESASPKDSSDDSSDSVDLSELAQTPGQVKVYNQVEVKPIASSTLLNNVEAPVQALQLTADNSHLLAGSSDGGKMSVVDLSTGKVEFNLASSQTGRFAGSASTPDKKTYFMAVNPSRSTLMQYQADLASDELISQYEPTDFRPQSFVFRYDSNGQPIKETDSQFNAFTKFKGYQILQIAPPLKSDTGLMAVALSDGLVHVINVETGSDFMRFYPSNTAIPVPVWTNDNISAAKKDRDKFKELYKVIKPSVVPTVMEFLSDRYLATGNSQGEAFVWDMEDYSPVDDVDIFSLQKINAPFSAKESDSAVINMRADSSGDKLYVFWADGHVGVWDWKNNRVVKKGFVDQNVKYAQILADKYLLVQNVKGEVSIWSWDKEKVNQIGAFKPQTELVIADPECILFWATLRGASESNLTLYALPSDFAEAIKEPEFAKLFKAIIIYPVPEESVWKSKLDRVKMVLDKSLNDASDDKKKTIIQEWAKKLPDANYMAPDFRYAFYMSLIQSMAQLKDKEQTLELVDSVTKLFDADKNELKLEAYSMLLKELKSFERIKAANELLNLCEQMLPSSSNKETILEIVKKIRSENYSKELSDRAKALLKKYI